MFSNQGARKSMDSLSPTTATGPRGDFPFHGCDATTVASADENPS